MCTSLIETVNRLYLTAFFLLHTSMSFKGDSGGVGGGVVFYLDLN